MGLVVDVGCYPLGHDSIHGLIERFDPAWVAGFDPYPEQRNRTYRVGGTMVVEERAAAWTRDGAISLVENGTASTVMQEAEVDGDLVEVRCFDFPAWLAAVTRPSHSRIIVKLDCEGAEYPLLERMIELGVDARLELLLVEWHRSIPGAERRRAAIVESLRCPLEPWQD